MQNFSITFRMDFYIFVLIVMNCFVCHLHIVQLSESLASVSIFQLVCNVVFLRFLFYVQVENVHFIRVYCWSVSASAWNEHECGYSCSFSHLLAFDGFALFITLPAQRQFDWLTFAHPSHVLSHTHTLPFSLCPTHTHHSLSLSICAL